jgi:hypothetical protein
MRTVHREGWFLAVNRGSPEFPEATGSFRRQQEPLGTDGGRLGHRSGQPHPRLPSHQPLHHDSVGCDRRPMVTPGFGTVNPLIGKNRRKVGLR